MVIQLAVYGDVASAVATLDHVLVPAGERWNSALATPDPPSAESDVTTKVPLMTALDAGAITDPVGAVLSTRTLAIVADVNVLPTLSVVTTRTS